jgi:hypothetical protein
MSLDEIMAAVSMGEVDSIDFLLRRARKAACLPNGHLYEKRRAFDALSAGVAYCLASGALAPYAINGSYSFSEFLRVQVMLAHLMPCVVDYVASAETAMLAAESMARLMQGESVRRVVAEDKKFLLHLIAIMRTAADTGVFGSACAGPLVSYGPHQPEGHPSDPMPTTITVSSAALTTTQEFIVHCAAMASLVFREASAVDAVSSVAGADLVEALAALGNSDNEVVAVSTLRTFAAMASRAHGAMLPVIERARGAIVAGAGSGSMYQRYSRLMALIASRIPVDDIVLPAYWTEEGRVALLEDALQFVGSHVPSFISRTFGALFIGLGLHGAVSTSSEPGVGFRNVCECAARGDASALKALLMVLGAFFPGHTLPNCVVQGLVGADVARRLAATLSTPGVHHSVVAILAIMVNCGSFADVLTTPGVMSDVLCLVRANSPKTRDPLASWVREAWKRDRSALLEAGVVDAVIDALAASGPGAISIQSVGMYMVMAWELVETPAHASDSGLVKLVTHILACLETGFKDSACPGRPSRPSPDQIRGFLGFVGAVLDAAVLSASAVCAIPGFLMTIMVWMCLQEISETTVHASLLLNRLATQADFDVGFLLPYLKFHILETLPSGQTGEPTCSVCLHTWECPDGPVLKTCAGGRPGHALLAATEASILKRQSDGAGASPPFSFVNILKASLGSRGADFVTLPCFCRVHRGCLFEWLARGNGTCPVCNASASLVVLDSLYGIFSVWNP